MKPINLVFLIAALWHLSAALLHAQNDSVAADENDTFIALDLWLGVESGSTLNYHSGGFRFEQNCDCPVFEQGVGWGYSVGAVVDFRFGESWGELLRIAFESRPGFFEMNSGPATEPAISLSANVTYQLLSMAFLFRQYVTAPTGRFQLALAAGPAFSYLLRGDVRQRRSEGSETILVFDGGIPGVASTFFALQGGILADIGIAGHTCLRPGIFYTFGLTDLTENENWRLSAVDLRLAVMMEL